MKKEGAPLRIFREPNQEKELLKKEGEEKNPLEEKLARQKERARKIVEEYWDHLEKDTLQTSEQEKTRLGEYLVNLLEDVYTLVSKNPISAQNYFPAEELETLYYKHDLYEKSLIIALFEAMKEKGISTTH